MRICVTLLLCFLIDESFGQLFSGIWRGHFTVGLGADQSKYLFEVQLHETDNHLVKGVAYTYTTHHVYIGKTSVSGSVKGDQLQLKEQKMLSPYDGNVKNLNYMSFTLQRLKINHRILLQGGFTSYNPYKKESGESGQMLLEKKESSHFYDEPFLNKK